MAQYRVKEGCKAFLGSALREGGYTFQVEKPFKEVPEWAEEVKAEAKGKVAAKAPAAKEDPKAASPAEPVAFVEEDLVTTPTVTL